MAQRGSRTNHLLLAGALALGAALVAPLLPAATAPVHRAAAIDVEPVTRQADVASTPIGVGTRGDDVGLAGDMPARPAADSGRDGPSAQYQQALAHAGDAVRFEPGARVSLPFVPRADDDWTVDGAAPQALPAGDETGRQMRASHRDASPVASPVAAPLAVRSSPSDPTAHAGPELASVVLPPDAHGIASSPVSSSGLRREVFGFLPWWELGSDSTVLDWRTLSTVAYFSVGCTGSGNLLKRNPDGSLATGWAGWTSSKMTSVLQAAHQHQTRVVLTISCFAWSADGAAAQAALLSSATARSRLARQIAAAVRDRGADGVNLDFEPLVAGSADQFTSLVRSVRRELNAVARGYQLTFDAMGSIGNQPIAAATAPGGADAVLVMAYDYRTEHASVAGSISPLSGPAYDLTDTIRAYTSIVSPSKVILGVPWYGRAWSTATDDPHAANISGGRNGAVAEPQYADAAALLAAYGRRWDAIEQSPWTAYRKRTCTPRNGCVTTWRELYVDDAASLRLRYDLINRASLRGVGIWALGFDGTRPELRKGLAAKFLTDRTPPVAGIATLPQRTRDEGFRVAWSSYDESAIRGYDIQVSVDGRAWKGWLAGVTNTSAVFSGTNGHVYAFRVRATDVRGNVSAWRSVVLGSLAAPGSIAVGKFATVLTDGLRLRAAPSTNADVLTLLGAGDALRVIGGPRFAGGYTWYQVDGPVRQWTPVDTMQIGGWVAAVGNGYRNVGPRSPVYATRVDAGIVGLRLNDGGARALVTGGPGPNAVLRIDWTNRRGFDRIALRIYRSNGSLLGTIPLGAGRTTSGAHAFLWDGKLDGRTVPSGAYVLQVQAIGGGSTFSAPSGAPVSAVQLARWGVTVSRIGSTSIAAASTSPASPTRAASIAYALTFGGPITGLTASDFVVSGSSSGCVVLHPAGRGATWRVTVSGCRQGTLLLSLRSGSVQDAVANRGPAQRVSLPAVVIDRSAPVAAAPRVTLRTGVSLPSASPTAGIAVTVAWSARDGGGAGLAGYDVRTSRDGAAFVDVAFATPSLSLATSFVPGHVYRFEVRARDRAGNVGGWVAGSTIRAALVQENASAIRFGSGWLGSANAQDSAGHLRFATTSGAAMSSTFTGRAIAWVATVAANRGAARVYLDGVLVATVVTRTASLAVRRVVWSHAWARSGTHTLRIVAVATAGNPRIDVDAFEILR